MYEPEGDECPVCFESKSDRIMTTSPCGHSLCLVCLLKLRAASCPMCRFDLTHHIPPRDGTPKIQMPLHITTTTSQTSTESPLRPIPPRLTMAQPVSTLQMLSNVSATIPTPASEEETLESIFRLTRLIRDREGDLLSSPSDTTPPLTPPGRTTESSSPPSTPPPRPMRPSRLRHVFLSPISGPDTIARSFE